MQKFLRKFLQVVLRPRFHKKRKTQVTFRNLKFLMEKENKISGKPKRRKTVNGFMLLQQTINIRSFFSKKNVHKKNMTVISEMLYQLVTTAKKKL